MHKSKSCSYTVVACSPKAILDCSHVVIHTLYMLEVFLPSFEILTEQKDQKSAQIIDVRSYTVW